MVGGVGIRSNTSKASLILSINGSINIIHLLFNIRTSASLMELKIMEDFVTIEPQECVQSRQFLTGTLFPGITVPSLTNPNV